MCTNSNRGMERELWKTREYVLRVCQDHGNFPTCDHCTGTWDKEKLVKGKRVEGLATHGWKQSLNELRRREKQEGIYRVD